MNENNKIGILKEVMISLITIIPENAYFDIIAFSSSHSSLFGSSSQAN